MGTYLFDQYTVLHLATGIVAYFFGVSWYSWLFWHTVFEYVENTPNGMHIINTYLKVWPGGKPHADTFINNVGDTIGAMVGWMIAYVIDVEGTKRGWYH
jgi:hypothetical protein